MAKKKDSAAWKLAINNLGGAIGRTFKDGAYRLLKIHDRGLVFERRATGKEVRVSRGLIERTYDQLAAGEEIAFREISYTVAIEYGVLLALNGFVVADEERRRYRARGRGRKKSPRDDGKFTGLALGVLPWLILVAA